MQLQEKVSEGVRLAHMQIKEEQTAEKEGRGGKRTREEKKIPFASAKNKRAK